MSESDEKKDLQELRDALESLDRELLHVLRRRMDVVEQVADAKLDTAYPFRDQEREDRILSRVRQAAVEARLDPYQIEQLYRHILETSVAHQQAHIRASGRAPLRVAVFGVEGSYSHLAAQRRYSGRSGGVLLLGFASVHAAMEKLTTGVADLALLPIENSTAGSINETYDVLARNAVHITGETVLAVEHCLLALPGVKLEALRTVVSHPQALAQCEEFLKSVPWIEARAEFDTAGAARKVREMQDASVGAIASESAGRLFGLDILRRGIQTDAGNMTRFVEVSREPASCAPDQPCKTSLLVVLGHRPGALGEVLVCFGRRGLNLTKLESRPIPTQPWRYRFYIDVEAHIASEPFEGALREVAPLLEELRALGTYATGSRGRVPE